MRPKVIDATPEKRIVLAIIAEYDLKRSICELVDNALDIWSKNSRTPLTIKIGLDDRQQTITIEDNAGGLEEEKLDHLVSPGKTSNAISDDVIGYFGVGSKRAVIALSQEIAIHSRFKQEKTFSVKFGQHWIDEEEGWTIPYEESPNELEPSSTLIELSRLRVHITPEEIESLKMHLSEVYSRFLRKGIVILVNGENISPVSFDDDWTFPPGYSPKRIAKKISNEGREVKVDIVSGLIDHPGDPENSYGVFVYCNDRLIARGLTNFDVGFVKGMVGQPHYNISLVRTIVSLKGQSQDMPWDSSKSGISGKHEVFKMIRPDIIEVTKSFAQISRSLQGNWETENWRNSQRQIGRVCKHSKILFAEAAPK
jgi:Histidine kinase-, DNA gyrase B-, and HSP90-like ATPase